MYLKTKGPKGPTRVYEHVLLQVLNACEAHSAGGTLEGPVGAIGPRAGRGADVEVVGVLDPIKPGSQGKTRANNHKYKCANAQIQKL